MKIRQGFVSNSSSSSFLIVGTKLTHYSQLEKAKNPYFVGKYLCDGLDVIPLLDHQDILNFLLKLVDYSWLGYLYDVLDYGSESGQLSSDELFAALKENKTLHYECGEADYHNTSDLNEFIDRYMNEN